MAEFSGVATLDASNTGVNGLFGASLPIAGTSTVHVTGGEALVGFGFGNNTPIATIGFKAGEYVMDAAARAIVVQSGEVYWDDPLARWADAFVFEGGAKSGSAVYLTGTGFEGNATAGTFVLYEGNGEAHDVAAPDTAISLRCDQSGNEGRARTGDYTTECYGDLATDSTGANLALDGAALEANGDYPNPEAAQLVANGAAMFHMRGGRGRGIGETAADYSPQIAFTGANTVAIKNDVAGGERYVQGGGFSIDGGAVGCDHTSETVLRHVGGVAAYCQSGLDAFAQAESPPPVGVANTGFVGGGVLLTVGNPGAIAGVDNLYAIVSPVVGFSLDDNGVLSADGISNLADGPNNVIVNQRIGAVPGAGLPEERMIDLNVHKLSDTGAPVVIQIGKDPADNSIFPGSNGVSGDNFGFVFEDIGIEGVDDAGLTVNNVSYDHATNEFSVGAELTESDIGGNFIVVTITASNVRGTHIMTVNVLVVDIVQIEPANRVFPNENIAAAADYTGPIAEAAGLVNSNAQGNVTFQCNVVGGDTGAFTASATGTGCSANLISAIGDAATSKEVQIEIVHTATPFYTQALLAPFNGQQPDGSGSSIPDAVITANITVWKAEADTQYNNANSDGEVFGVSFSPPANPGGGIYFYTDGSWAVVGTPEEGLQVAADGSISGTVSDRPGDDADDGIYVVMITANFMHGLLAGGLPVEMELTVSDFSFPTTLSVVAANANGNVIVRIAGEIRATVGSTAAEIVADTNRVLIEIVAVPNPSYHVETWSASGGGLPADFAGNCPAGHGGFKTCVLPRRTDHLPVNLTVAFAAGAIHPDLPETGDVPVGIHTCFALGGSVQRSPTSISCSGYTAGFSDSCRMFTSGIAPTCQEIFNGVRDCNLTNSPAVSVDFVSDSVTCGTACTAGEFAIGGQCVSSAYANHAVVTYAQPASGGNIAAYYASSGEYVASGDLVPHSALISVVGTPASNAYVADFLASCENDADLSGGPANISPETLAPPSTGGFSDTGVKFCLARATVNVDASAFFVEIPASYVPFPDIPSSVDDMGGDASVQQTLCEAYGGTFESAAGVGKCSGLWSNDSSLSCTFGSAAAAGNCAAPMRGVRECNDKNKPAANLDNSVTSCDGTPCPSGHFARGASCVTS